MVGDVAHHTPDGWCCGTTSHTRRLVLWHHITHQMVGVVAPHHTRRLVLWHHITHQTVGVVAPHHTPDGWCCNLYCCKSLKTTLNFCCGLEDAVAKASVHVQLLISPSL